MYEREGVNLRNSDSRLIILDIGQTHHHSQFAAKLIPNGKPRMSNTGMAKRIGKRKLMSYYFVRFASPLVKRGLTVKPPLAAKLQPKVHHPRPPMTSLSFTGALLVSSRSASGGETEWEDRGIRRYAGPLVGSRDCRGGGASCNNAINWAVAAKDH